MASYLLEKMENCWGSRSSREGRCRHRPKPSAEVTLQTPETPPSPPSQKSHFGPGGVALSRLMSLPGATQEATHPNGFALLQELRALQVSTLRNLDFHLRPLCLGPLGCLRRDASPPADNRRWRYFASTTTTKLVSRLQIPPPHLAGLQKSGREWRRELETILLVHGHTHFDVPKHGRGVLHVHRARASHHVSSLCLSEPTSCTTSALRLRLEWKGKQDKGHVF